MPPALEFQAKYYLCPLEFKYAPTCILEFQGKILYPWNLIQNVPFPWNFPRFGPPSTSSQGISMTF